MRVYGDVWTPLKRLGDVNVKRVELKEEDIVGPRRGSA
jgi:hypothetical protein